jgi:hypothetical protein
MKRTTAVLAFFVAAVLAGVFVNSTLLSASPVVKEKFMQVDDQKLFAFADNRQGPECMGSPFSGDLGYVCLTDSQRAEFATRAGNRSS